MAIVLFDNREREGLYPLAVNKAVADLRIGILRIKEWWLRKTNLRPYVATTNQLQILYSPIPEGEHIWIDASIVADDALVQRILKLKSGQCLVDAFGLVAGKTDQRNWDYASHDIGNFSNPQKIDTVTRLQYPWQIFQWNDKAIREDFQLLTHRRKSQPLSSTNRIQQYSSIFVEEGARVEYAMLNATQGPIYIGKNPIIQEGAMIFGPVAIGTHAMVKMGATVYGATTLGPWCVAGGEIKNVMMMGYSNKGHHGYLGDSVVGEWCNFGAGTSNSNVKNTAETVTLWHKATQSWKPVGQKCGLIMGDYTRTAINSSINTGSMIGISSNLFGAGLLPRVIPDFTWGDGRERYRLDKAIEAIGNWKKMKGQEISSAEIAVLQHIFEQQA